MDTFQSLIYLIQLYIVKQHDTNVDIQLNALIVLSTASSYQRNELSKQMEISGDNDKNLVRL